MAQTMLSIRMDENLKKEMEEICQELGLNMTTAFTIFAKQMVREKKIPFEVSATGGKKVMTDMTIDDKMAIVANELADEFHCEHVITRGELQHLMYERFNVTPGSVIPSDYCYNRLNNGITLNKPTLFKYLGGGKYLCLGEGYCYNGPILHRPRGEKTDKIIGECIDGERIPDYPFWEND